MQKFSWLLAAAFTLASPNLVLAGFVAGVNPSERPAGAPVVTE